MNPEDTVADEPSSPVRTTVPVEARWAVGLGAALLLALALLTAARRMGQPAAAAEEIVQIPVATVAPTPTPPLELLAPDPGDHP